MQLKTALKIANYVAPRIVNWWRLRRVHNALEAARHDDNVEAQGRAFNDTLRKR